MLPPRLIRRLVLAPLVIVIAFGFIVLSPFLALAALVVMKAALQLDPSVDIVGNRLPNVWIKSRVDHREPARDGPGTAGQ